MRLSIENFSSKDLKILNPSLEIIQSGSSSSKINKGDSKTYTSKVKDFNEIENILVYPNPTSTLLNIFLNNYRPMDNSILEIYNIQGKLLYSKKRLLQNNSIDMSKYAKGIYLFKISNDDRVGIQKVILN